VDYYELLDLARDADDETVRKALNQQIRKLQPLAISGDRETRASAEDKLKVLFKAREVFYSPEKKLDYDQELETKLAPPSDEKPAVHAAGTGQESLSPGGYSIALLIDTSGSMSGQKIDDARKAALTFLDNIQATDSRVALISFGHKTGVIRPLGAIDDGLRKAVEALYTGNGTPMQQAIVEADAKALRMAEHNRVMIIATDGQPNEPKPGIVQLAERIKDRGSRIITIGIGRDVDEDFLRKLASSPDDYHFAEGSFQLGEIYQEIAHGLAAVKHHEK